jgi:hypothetical protein
MDRRNFIAAGISAFFFALFPWLRPKPAVLSIAVEEFMQWQNYAMWQMCRGYALRWQIGQHTNILDESLVHVETPPSQPCETRAIV